MPTRHAILLTLFAAATVAPAGCDADPPVPRRAAATPVRRARPVPPHVPAALRGLWARGDGEQEAAIREAWRRPDQSVPVFLSFVAQPEEDVPLDRSEVARFLCRFRSRAAPGVVRAFLRGDTPIAAFVLERMAATGGLGRDGAQTVPGLVQALDRPALRGTALLALRALGPCAAPAAPRIALLLEEPRCDCIDAAAAALGAIRAEPALAVPALLRHLDHEACVLALGSFGARAGVAVAPLARRVGRPVAGTLRSSAAESLLRIGAPAEETLSALLRDPGAATDVVRTFAVIDGPSPGPEFSAALGEFAIRSGRAFGLEAIRALESRAGQGAGAIPALANAARRAGAAQDAAIEAYARIAPAADVGAVVDPALDSVVASVRAAAADAARRAEPASDDRTGRLVSLAVGDCERRIRFAAAAALLSVPGGAGRLAAAAEPVPGACVDAVRAALAVDAIRRGASTFDGAALAGVLTGDPDGDALRREAVAALAGRGEVIPADVWGGANPADLARAISDWRDGDARWWPTERAWRHARAARALGGTGAPGWFALADGGPCRRRVVADMWETEIAALGADVEPYVVAGLGSDDPTVRAAAARAAPWLRPDVVPTLVPQLDALLDDAVPSVRAAALRGLRRCGAWDEARAARVAALSEDRDPSVRVAAAATLWRMTGDAAVVLPVLAAAVATPATASGPVNPQGEAAETLREMGARAAPVVGDLRESLRNLQHPFTWEAVCDTLGEIGPAAAEAVPELERAAAGALTRSPLRVPVDPAVYRVPAIRALGRVTRSPESPPPVLVRAAADRNAEVRTTARLALASPR